MFPKPYEEAMKALLGEEQFAAYCQTFERDYWQGLRVNTAKISPQAFARRYGDPMPLRPVPWCPAGFYLNGETKQFSKHPDYYAGLYYLQEPSAMAPAAILPVEEGDRVLDLCAAPGGKSTALSAKLGRSGLLVSNDISPSRAKALLKNLELQGATQAVVLAEAPYKLAQHFPGWFNKILVDAPCSGEGMFHKDKSIMKNWEQYGNAYYAKLQREILQQAVTMLAPGGMLLYSTCTFSPMEDEQMVEWLLESHEELSLLPIAKVGGMEDGQPGWSHSGREDLRYTARFWPHKLEGQGHFAALLQKKDGAQTQPAIVQGGRGGFGAQDLLLFEAFCQETLTKEWQQILPPHNTLQKLGDKLYASPLPHGALSSLRVLRNGVLLGELKKGRFEPSQALAMTLCRGDCKREVDLNEEDALRYLKGETLQGSFPDGWTLVLTGGFPLGWGKAVKGLLKNKYLKSWLM